MDWLADLGKNNKMIVVEHVQKNRKRRTYNQAAQNVREYKQLYYLENYMKYRERNRKASEERTLERINRLTNAIIIDAIADVIDE
jgi:predicted amidophosphoribosyltransferase